MFCFLVFTSLILSVPTVITADPAASVHVLTTENFDSMLQSVGGLWFLKFYAPWCGHCKAMAPTLEEVAPQLAGKMSIGKIDCTSHKKLCDRYKVKGFPTLKVHRDGETFDYPGERTAKSIKWFAEKMNAAAIVSVKTHKEMVDVTKQSDTGVAFLLHDPDDDPETRAVFSKVARKLQASATFISFEPDVSLSEVAKMGDLPNAKGFVARVEDGVPPRFPTGSASDPEILSGFVEASNVATVVRLGSKNFRKVADGGRLMAIAVANGDEDLTESLRATALAHPQYAVGFIDGIKWKRFLQLYGVESPPTFLIMDYPNKTYNDATEDGRKPKDMADLIESHGKGELPSKRVSKGSGGNPLYKDWRIIVAVLLFCVLVFFAINIFVDEDVEEEKTTGELKEKTTGELKEETKEETKKEK